MSKFWKIWIMAACLVIAMNIAMDEWYWPSKVDQAYERGKIDGQAPDTMETYVTMELIPPSEVIRQVTGDDTLYFRRKKVDTGYILTPIYIVFKPWVPYRSDWREEWLDTSRGWYGFEISEEFARAWYDGVDSTHTTYGDALQDWAISVLLRESKFTIYFYPTGTILGPAVEGDRMSGRDSLVKGGLSGQDSTLKEE